MSIEHATTFRAESGVMCSCVGQMGGILVWVDERSPARVEEALAGPEPGGDSGSGSADLTKPPPYVQAALY